MFAIQVIENDNSIKYIKYHSYKDLFGGEVWGAYHLCEDVKESYTFQFEINAKEFIRDILEKYYPNLISNKKEISITPKKVWVSK